LALSEIVLIVRAVMYLHDTRRGYMRKQPHKMMEALWDFANQRCNSFMAQKSFSTTCSAFRCGTRLHKPLDWSQAL